MLIGLCFYLSLYVLAICGVNQNAVTGEHTCMVLKALHNDDIEADASDQFGFVGPFYRGELVYLSGGISSSVHCNYSHMVAFTL